MDAHAAQAEKEVLANAPGDSNLSTVQKLRKGAYLSVELNAQTAVPEWGDQKVYIMGEDDAYLTDDGYKFFIARQTEFYLISPKVKDPPFAGAKPRLDKQASRSVGLALRKE